MRIVFENIQPDRADERVMVDTERHDAIEARAIIAAYINSSNLNANGTRQDFGWRLVTEQAAIVEGWLKDPAMAKKISEEYKIPVEDLQYYDFVSYLIDQSFAEEARKDKVNLVDQLAEAERNYRERIKSIAEGTPIEIPQVEPVVFKASSTQKPVKAK